MTATVHQFPSRQSAPKEWPPVRQSYARDWHRQPGNDNRPLLIGECVAVWIASVLLGWFVAIGSGWCVARVLEWMGI